MQVLEGEEETVRRLYHKIADDIRHRGTIVLLEEANEERQFPGWSMGFRDLNSPETLAVSGYHEFMNTPLTGEEFSSNPAHSQMLLLTCRKSRF